MGTRSYFELSLLGAVFDAAGGIHLPLCLGTAGRELLSPRAKLSLMPQALTPRGEDFAQLPQAADCLFVSLYHPNLLG